MTVLRLGSLCTGYGGLDLAADAVLGPLEHAWHAENDPHASRVLAHHWPHVPNHGDLTTVDWTAVAPVDVLTAGYPCQPLSLAGRRAGMTDERWIWNDIAHAIRVLRPRIVLLENVAGHLSLGFGRVLGDLATLGLDAQWGCVRASDIGAPHRRERVFIAAWPTNTPRPRLEKRRQRRPGTGTTTDPARLEHRHPRPKGIGGIPAAAVTGAAEPGRDSMRLLPTPRTNDMRGPGTHGSGGPDLRTAVALMPTPRASDGEKGGPNQRGSSGDLALPAAVQPERFGVYTPAIRRWEHILGRPAPAPTEPGTRGQPRLNAAFVEWLMGLGQGWVTDHLARNPALRCLGNGVVPQQATHAITDLLTA